MRRMMESLQLDLAVGVFQVPCSVYLLYVIPVFYFFFRETEKASVS